MSLSSIVLCIVVSPRTPACHVVDKNCGPFATSGSGCLLLSKHRQVEMDKYLPSEGTHDAAERLLEIDGT